MNFLILLVVVVVVVKLARALVSFIPNRRRRMRTITRAIDTARDAAAWVHRPRPTTAAQVIGAVVGVPFFIWWSGSLLWGLGTVAFLLIVVNLTRLGYWLAKRRRLTLDAGLPASPRRMVWDFVNQRNLFGQVEKRWERACAAQSGLRFGGDAVRLSRLELTPTGDVRALVDPGALGGDVESIVKVAGTALPGAMRCREVAVTPAEKPGTAWISFLNSNPLHTKLPVSEMPIGRADSLVYGRTADGGAAQFPMNKHVLVGGMSGMGKSSLWWSIHTDLVRKAVGLGFHFNLHAIDLKGGVELGSYIPHVGEQIGGQLIASYCRTADESIALLDRVIEVMKGRYEEMLEAGISEWLPEMSERWPLTILMIDECLEVFDFWADHKAPGATVKGQAMKRFTNILLAQARAAGFMIIGLTQSGEVRDLGPVRRRMTWRLCLGTDNAMGTNMILGDGAEAEGAQCSKIQIAGLGHAAQEGIRGFQPFRAAWVEKDQRVQVAGAHLPRGVLPQSDAVTDVPTKVYVLPDKCKAGRTFYVGQSNNIHERFKQHRKFDVGWCSDHERVENLWKVHADEAHMPKPLELPSRPAALIAEERLIKQLKPYLNIVHNRSNPLANVNLSKRAALPFRARLKAEEIGSRAQSKGAELTEAGRGEWALHQVKADLAKQERVAAAVAKRDRFMETVDAGAYR